MTSKTPESKAAGAKAERLAQALRDNLKRRKAAGRAAAETTSPVEETSPKPET